MNKTKQRQKRQRRQRNAEQAQLILADLHPRQRDVRIVCLKERSGDRAEVNLDFRGGVTVPFDPDQDNVDEVGERADLLLTFGQQGEA